MTIQEALKILGVTKEDDEKTIKLQFRKMIARYHPDSVGSDSPEHLRMAQLLNEAYALLRKRKVINKKKEPQKPAWNGKENKAAFTERTIYMSGVSWEGEQPEQYKVTRGRYEWDPDLEEFHCFLRSLNEAVMELLEKAEYTNGIYNDYEYNLKAQRFDYQIQLFHLLAGQFISPVSCLKKLVKEVETDDRERVVYKLPAFLGETGSGKVFSAMSKLKEGDLLFATSIKNNRIMLSDGEGTALGHLSLQEDCLYYVIVPILQNHMAQVKFVVREVDSYRGGRPYRIKIKVDLYLRMEKTTDEVRYTDQNIKIGEVLHRYDAYLKSLTRYKR
ncbi:MAG: DnaJ domain-containing protein [bacterium]|nr:DnaJ domain-containing protein [bacterium]